MLKSLRNLSLSRLANLRNSRTTRAAAWSVGAFVVGQLVRIGGNLTMTRILVPEMFGVMAVVLVIQIMLAMFSDVGIRIIVIQSKRHDEAFLNTAWTLEVIRGFVLWLIGLLIATGLFFSGKAGWLPLEAAWGAPDLPSTLAATTFAATIVGFQSVNVMTASRNLELRKVSLIELGAQVSGLVVMVFLGILTGSIWALVAGSLVAACVTTIAGHVWLPGIASRFAWDHETLVEIYRSGRWLFLSSIVFVLATSIDRLLLAGLVTATVLGVYSIALNLLLMIEGVGGRLINSVVLPSLSEVAREDPERFPDAVNRIRRPLDFAYLGFAGLVYAAGATIVEVLYDDRYRDAGTMLQVLSFSLVFSRYGVLVKAYVALGEPRFEAMVNVAKLMAAVVLLLTMYSWRGFEGALYAIALHGVLTLPLIFWINKRYGLNNFKYEMSVLPMWLVGYLAGLAGAQMLRAVMGALTLS